ncbi:acyl-CoA dehydrogenase [Mycolicibacterium sarraceniae]|nr:acyl-CoA dehydrogenase [Mycolicibacterium sarraceniae]
MKLPVACIGLSRELHGLADSVAAFAARNAPIADTRARLGDLAAGALPLSWKSLVDNDFHRVHLGEDVGGAGAGLVELAVICEQLGRTLFPGPFLPTVMASAALATVPDHPAASRLLSRFSGGETGAIVSSRGMSVDNVGDRWNISGTTETALGLPGADIVVMRAQSSTGHDVLIPIPVQAVAVSVTVEEPTDLTRPAGRLTVDNLEIPGDHVIPCSASSVELVVTALLAAEAAGVAQWCVQASLDHITRREQFGRVIGSFQAVQHKAAMMLVHAEVARSAAWDAARAIGDDPAQQQLAADAAAVSSLQLARDIALDAVLLHGGIGYTWEHDAHLYWRKAVSLAGAAGARQQRAHALGAAAVNNRRSYDFVDPTAFADLRQHVGEVLDRAMSMSEQDARVVLADAGLVAPHYPAPYGIGAGPQEQVVVAEEFLRRGLRQPTTVVGEWVLPTLLLHGSPEQQQRFLSATLDGRIVWCQLFSEPGAGSDLAGLSTSARRVAGGWQLNGQKVWTSNAHVAHWGACLARTDPHAPKHRGISYFLVKMESPGVEVRPIRQATGRSEFNEVFLTDVFVPDDCVVGEVNDGWKLATTTLANERLKMGNDFAHGSTRHLRQAIGNGDVVATPEEALRVLGECTAREMALAAIGLRTILGRLSGLDTGAATSVQKVFNALAQRQGSVDTLSVVGPAGCVSATYTDYATDHLALPASMTGGGTVEIQLNVIAQRLLGLPR